MPFPIYLAMTQQEMQQCDAIPPHFAWMACQFSSSGPGISHIPRDIPEHALLILTDQFPPDGHDPDTVAGQLTQAVEELKADRVLLDFQRPYTPQCHQIVHRIQKVLPCPCAVTPTYMEDWQQAILVPPIPPNKVPAMYLSAWAGRELWLELEREGILLSVTENGCISTPLKPRSAEPAFRDEKLCCHYNIKISRRQADFLLQRTWEDQLCLLETVQALGVTLALGLYQQFYFSPEGHRVG